MTPKSSPIEKVTGNKEKLKKRALRVPKIKPATRKGTPDKRYT